MSVHPGLVLDNMSNDELLLRMADLSGKVGWMSAYSGSAGAVEQLNSMINAISIELSDRAGRASATRIARSNPVMIETDPVLKARDQMAAEDSQEAVPGKTAEPRTRRVKPIRTATPVVPQHEPTHSHDQTDKDKGDKP